MTNECPPHSSHRNTIGHVPSKTTKLRQHVTSLKGWWRFSFCSNMGSIYWIAFGAPRLASSLNTRSNVPHQWALKNAQRYHKVLPLHPSFWILHYKWRVGLGRWALNGYFIFRLSPLLLGIWNTCINTRCLANPNEPRSHFLAI